MVLVNTENVYKNESFLSVFIMVILSIFVASAAFSGAFVFRDLIFNLLEKYEIYNINTASTANIWYALFINTVLFIVLAFFVTVAYRLVNYYLDTPGIWNIDNNAIKDFNQVY